MYSIVTIHNYKIIQTFYNTTYANAESFWIQVQVAFFYPKNKWTYHLTSFN